jgi:hypothetical protein
VDQPRDQVGAPEPDGTAEAAIKEALEIAREALGMEAGYVAQFKDGEQVYREVAGDAESFEVLEDEGYPLDGSYCQRMVMGEIPNIVADSTAISRSPSSATSAPTSASRSPCPTAVSTAPSAGSATTPAPISPTATSWYSRRSRS